MLKFLYIYYTISCTLVFNITKNYKKVKVKKNEKNFMSQLNPYLISGVFNIIQGSEIFGL